MLFCHEQVYFTCYEGLGSYSFKTGDLTTSLGGILASGDHSVFAQWDNNVSVFSFSMRDVSP